MFYENDQIKAVLYFFGTNTIRTFINIINYMKSTNKKDRNIVEPPHYIDKTTSLSVMTQNIKNDSANHSS